MTIRLRQVALVAADLAAAEHAVAEALAVERCFRDPGVATFGLHNALFPVGEELLEIVSPLPDRDPASTTAGRFLERRGGDGGYMVILQTDEDLDDVRRRLDAHGARIVFEAVADGVTGLHVHPRDVGGAILSIDRTERWDDWPWAGPVWRDHVRTDRVTGIVGVDIAAADPAAMCERWAAVIGRRAEGTTIELDGGYLRFVEASGRGDGVDAIEIATAGDPAAEIVLAGCRVRFT